MRTTSLKPDKKLCLKAVFVCILLTVGFYWRDHLLKLISMIGDRDAIIDFLGQYGVMGPVILFFIIGLQVFLAVIPGHAFIVAGGYVYDFLLGAVITQLSTVIASQLAFFLARRYGRPVVNRIAPASVIDHWNKLAEKQGGLFFFFSFILPIFPNDLMCFVAGLSSISPKKFFLANFFGRLPCAIFVTLIGSHGLDLPLYFWALIVFVIVVATLFWKMIASQIEQHIFYRMPALRSLSPS